MPHSDDLLHPDAVDGSASGFSLTTLTAAAPDFLMAVLFLLTWIAPTLLGDNLYLYLFTVIAMEFLAIHSGGFFMYVFLGGCHWIIGVLALLALGAFYLFAGQAVAETIGQTWPLWGIIGLTLNRMKTLLFTRRSDKQRRNLLVLEWSLSMATFMIVSVLAFFPWPLLGLTDPMIMYDARGNEMVFDTPQFLMALGVLYFTTQGLLDLYRRTIATSLKRISAGLFGRVFGRL